MFGPNLSFSLETSVLLNCAVKCSGKWKHDTGLKQSSYQNTVQVSSKLKLTTKIAETWSKVLQKYSLETKYYKWVHPIFISMACLLFFPMLPLLPCSVLPSAPSISCKKSYKRLKLAKNGAVKGQGEGRMLVLLLEV